MHKKDYKILKFANRRETFTKEDVISKYGETSKVRLEELRKNKLIEYADYSGSSFAVNHPVGNYKITAKGKAELENIKTGLISAVFHWLKEQLTTIVVAFITSALTTYLLPKIVTQISSLIGR